jgi:hypothetical protein
MSPAICSVSSVVDAEGVRETAAFLGVEPVVLSGMYHDVMLGPRWQLAADEIAGWLDSLVEGEGEGEVEARQ